MTLSIPRVLIGLSLISSIIRCQDTKPRPEVSMQFIEYCTYFNYPVQEYLVETEDGYLLRVFRIQAKGQLNFEDKENVVFWQHGLLDSSDSGICNDEDKAPLFMLANRGYDVWVGNSRGNKHSKQHKTLSPKKAPFWQFSFQQMAEHDIPAVLGYVAKGFDLFFILTQVTGKKVHYIGHSQGTTQMFAALSLNIKGVRENMLSFIALAPVTFLTHINSKSLIEIADSKFAEIIQLFGINEFMGTGWYNEVWASSLCSVVKNLCNNLISGSMDVDTSVDNASRLDVMSGHVPSGTSSQNMIHWRQFVLKGLFYQFDYENIKDNQAHYGQDTAPLFPLQNIDNSLNVSIFLGSVDRLADPQDGHDLVEILRQKGQNVKTYEYYMGHSTFVNGLDMSFMNDVFNIIEQKQINY